MTGGTDSSDIEAAIRRRIRAVREAHDITQEELARRLGVEQPTVARYEKTRTPSTIMLHRIARALDTTMADLLRDVPGEVGAVNPEARRAVREAVDRWLGEDE